MQIDENDMSQPRERPWFQRRSARIVELTKRKALAPVQIGEDSIMNPWLQRGSVRILKLAQGKALAPVRTVREKDALVQDDQHRVIGTV